MLQHHQDQCYGNVGKGQRRFAQINSAQIIPEPSTRGQVAEVSSEPLMPVGLLTLELHIPDAQSLKDKRQVLRSLKDRLRRQFNVAVAELDHHEAWQRSVIGVVTLSNEEKHLQAELQKVLDEADKILGSFLINQNFEII
jgi:uncharacterized protein YlxP (DUF503 family)